MFVLCRLEHLKQFENGLKPIQIQNQHQLSKSLQNLIQTQAKFETSQKSGSKPSFKPFYCAPKQSHSQEPVQV